MQETISRIFDKADIRPFAARSIGGWVLPKLLMLEGPEHILRFTISASNLRRQCIFLALSAAVADDYDALADRFRRHCPTEDWRGECAPDLALALTNWRVERLLSILCDGDRPGGLIGVLSRAGHAPLARRSYRIVLDILAAHDERARILIEAKSISDLTVEAASKLDLALCRPGVLDRIPSRQTVESINAVAGLAREFADADDQALARSVSQPPRNWTRWATRWAEKSRRFPTTPAVPNGFIALYSAAAMKDAAARFGNCLASRIPKAAVGRRAYLEYGPGEAIIELDVLSGAAWLLSGIHGPNNVALDLTTFTEIVTKLRMAGVHIPVRIDESRERRAAARMLDTFDFDDDTADPMLEGLLNEARSRLEEDA